MFLVYFAALSILLCTQLGSAEVTVSCDYLTPGDKSGVICLSKTSFIFGFQNKDKDRPISCPEGQVCADVTEICATNQTPLCKNSKPGDKAACNDCIDPVAKGSPVCINKNEYSVCTNGIIQKNFVQKCPPETPFCKVKYDTNSGEVTSVCTYEASQFDCPDDPPDAGNSTNGGTSGGSGGTNGTSTTTTTTTTTKAPLQPFKCTVIGFFADASSVDCTSYLKCQPNAQGGFDELKFKCSSAGTAFNPASGKCEIGYKCV